jgi:probable phosphoglycerate mutase
MRLNLEPRFVQTGLLRTGDPRVPPGYENPTVAPRQTGGRRRDRGENAISTAAGSGTPFDQQDGVGRKVSRQRLNLHLLRHGETDLSRQDRFCGMLDTELTRDGHRMAEAFAARWARHASGPIWRAIYISTRRRAMETAAPFAAALGKVPIVDRGLDEINYGSWQGRTKDEIQRADPEGFRRWLADPMRGAPDGESAIEVARRARDVVEGIRCLHATEDRSGDVLVVGHKTWLRLLLCQLTGIELRLYRDRIPQPVAAHTVVEFDGRRWWLRRLADRSYLPPDLLAPLMLPNVSEDSGRIVAPEARGDLVGEQPATVGQADARVADVQPAGAHARGDASLATVEDVAGVAATMGVAVDAVDGA